MSLFWILTVIKFNYEVFLARISNPFLKFQFMAYDQPLENSKKILQVVKDNQMCP